MLAHGLERPGFSLLDFGAYSDLILFVARLYLGLDIKFKPNLVAAGGRHKFDRLICALNSGLNLIHLNLRPNLTSLSQLVNSLLKTGLNLRVVICFALLGCPRPLKFSEFYRFCAPLLSTSIRFALLFCAPFRKSEFDRLASLLKFGSSSFCS